MSTHRIAVIPGDGIGPEVMPEGLRVLEAAGKRFGIGFHFDHFNDWCTPHYLKHGTMMPDNWQAQIGGHDAIFFGAVGTPDIVPDHEAVWGSIIKIRREFDQFVNLRPVRLMRGVPAPLAHRQPGDIDFLVVRENTEGEYSSVGGRMFEGSDNEMAKRYPDVSVKKFHIDILCAHFVQHPDWFDVVVASNLFGDILSDLGPACTGTIGIAPSANLNPTRRHPSLFEPVHGSAPDIAGQGIANPIGQIWSAALMLQHLGQGNAAHESAAAHIVRCIEDVIATGPRTRDMGGTASTVEVGQAIAAAVAATSTDRVKNAA